VDRLARSRQLYWFDLRMASSVMLARAEGVIAEAADEVNQIAVKDALIALPDDSGSLTLLDDHQVKYFLGGLHTNVKDKPDLLVLRLQS
jgi:hypothetical protein